MYQTILAGFDGSPHGAAAVRFAASLARTFRSDLVIASAYTHTPHVRMDGSALEGLARSEAEEQAQRGLELCGVLDARKAVMPGSTPAAALHQLAWAERTDLVVVGTSHRRRIAGTQPGSVTERVLHHSPCPVAVVPPTEDEASFARIGVALDAKAPARAALAAAVALAEALGDAVEELVILHAEPPEPLLYDPALPQPARPATDPPRWLNQALDELAAPVPVRLVRVAGTAPDMLAAHAGELDLLVMGSRDRGPLSRLAMGSVSTHGVRHARCPVLVVFDRAGAEAGNAGASVSETPA